MGIEQGYARATISSNLKDDEHHHDHEKLAAVALAGLPTGSPANLLFRVKYANDATSYKALLDEWEVIVGTKAVTRTWPQHIDYKKVAKVSLDHWLNDLCQDCGGKGVVPVPGVPSVLSDHACASCQGSGKKTVECNGRMRDYVEDMVETLQAMTVHAGGLAIKKLAQDIDFV